MDKLQFYKACDRVINQAYESGSKGIGTLGEKTLHSVLKNYFEPDEACHEIKIGSFVADIALESGIIEIQTRQFEKLRKKLELFLRDNHVTVVYPIAHTKWLVWIDEATGETTKKRKSPKAGKAHEVLTELYKIKQQLKHPNLSVCVVLMALEEYRYLNGWNENKKRGSTRCDRIPVEIIDEVYINSLDDYNKLIPDELGSQFTSKEFTMASNFSLHGSQTALNVLDSVGAVVRVGKRGNAYIYERAVSPINEAII